MKKIYAVLGMSLAFGAGALVSAQVHDMSDLDKVHKHVIEAIHEMEHARAANNYDMNGHGAKAEQFLRDAEHELDAAVSSAMHNGQ